MGRVVPALVTAALLGASACAHSAGTGEAQGDADSTLVIDRDALLPARLAVHPLTRIGVGRPSSAGGPAEDAIILHLELRDRFEQPVEALGRVEVGLYKPVESAGAGQGDIVSREDKLWTIDLTGPRANAEAYDALVTRTYTLYLGTLPDWLLAWRGATPTEDVGRLSPSLEVVFKTTDAEGNIVTLRTRHRLRR